MLANNIAGPFSKYFIHLHLSSYTWDSIRHQRKKKIIQVYKYISGFDIAEMGEPSSAKKK